ncbi:MAG: cytochrome oxidase assembly protein [Bdellovibrionaceae bacterium]|nr:cytochrome oxidase assembly protein [Pseudobdellovibrionaceae bacterium]|tara:strand:+ start:90 stop:1010 length:921 start_codon:yes stop_codon:yes gene_type:complete
MKNSIGVGVLVWNLLVILWGAVVRATGSGAGCGEHWPLCNGEIVPLSPGIETVIEFGHRVTSGFAFIFVVAYAIFLFRRYPQGNLLRKLAISNVSFIVIEALIGAGLVILGLVDQDTSHLRVWVIGLHLINTLLLILSLTVSCFAEATHLQRLPLIRRGSAGFGLFIGLLGMIILGASGAITALGDTLFPSESLMEGVAQDFDQGSHFLVQLRVFHPLLAVMIGGWIAWQAFLIETSDLSLKRIRLTVISLVFSGWLIGGMNWLLLAPVWMQMIHLLWANLIWISTIILFLKVDQVFSHKETKSIV